MEVNDLIINYSKFTCMDALSTIISLNLIPELSYSFATSLHTFKNNPSPSFMIFALWIAVTFLIIELYDYIFVCYLLVFCCFWGRNQKRILRYVQFLHEWRLLSVQRLQEQAIELSIIDLFFTECSRPEYSPSVFSLMRAISIPECRVGNFPSRFFNMIREA